MGLFGGKKSKEESAQGLKSRSSSSELDDGVGTSAVWEAVPAAAVATALPAVAAAKMPG